MKKFNVIFEVSFITKIPHTFLDNQMAVEFETENIDSAEEEAFRTICHELIEIQHSVIRKIELLEIQEINDKEVVQIREYIQNDE